MYEKLHRNIHCWRRATTMSFADLRWVPYPLHDKQKWKTHWAVVTLFKLLLWSIWLLTLCSVTIDGYDWIWKTRFSHWSWEQGFSPTPVLLIDQIHWSVSHFSCPRITNGWQTGNSAPWSPHAVTPEQYTLNQVRAENATLSMWHHAAQGSRVLKKKTASRCVQGRYRQLKVIHNKHKHTHTHSHARQPITA